MTGSGWRGGSGGAGGTGMTMTGAGGVGVGVGGTDGPPISSSGRRRILTTPVSPVSTTYQFYKRRMQVLARARRRIDIAMTADGNLFAPHGAKCVREVPHDAR